MFPGTNSKTVLSHVISDTATSLQKAFKSDHFYCPYNSASFSTFYPRHFYDIGQTLAALNTKRKTSELLNSAINLWTAFVTVKAYFLHLIYYHQNKMKFLDIPQSQHMWLVIKSLLITLFTELCWYRCKINSTVLLLAVYNPQSLAHSSRCLNLHVKEWQSCLLKTGFKRSLGYELYKNSSSTVHNSPWQRVIFLLVCIFS